MNFKKIIGLGMIAGLRAVYAPALLSHYLSQGEKRSIPQPLNFLASPTASNVLKVFAAGELVVDKLPGIPPRTFLPELGMRVISGSLAGAAVAGSDERKMMLAGALLGGMAATAAAYGGLSLRRWVERRFHLPDIVVGAAEDAVALGVGFATLGQNPIKA